MVRRGKQHASQGHARRWRVPSKRRDGAPLISLREAREIAMSERLTLPVLPLRGTVIFPGQRCRSVWAGRGRWTRSRRRWTGPADVRGCQRENVDEARPEQLYTMGVTSYGSGRSSGGRVGVQLLIQGETRALALHRTRRRDAILEAVVRPLEEMQPMDEKTGVRRARPRAAGAGDGAGRTPRAARGGAAPGGRRGRPTRARSPTWWRATSSCPAQRSRSCSRRWASRSGCAGCWSPSSATAAAWRRRRRSSRRSRRSSASGSARCSSASRSRPSRRSWARTTRTREIERAARAS